MPLPHLLIHADWSTNPAKRWLTRATLGPDGRYTVADPVQVGSPLDLMLTLVEEAAAGPVMAGFDFPIGLPLAYARLASISDFVAMLPRFGHGDWLLFYEVAERAEQIALRRPFYPRRPGGTRRQHLVDGLGLATAADLYRRCEQAHPGRQAAAPLFWTLGAQQVGKAAIAGWRDMLAPALRRRPNELTFWPFQGSLKSLLVAGQVVITETYPAEFYAHLGLALAGRGGQGMSKRKQGDRAACGPSLAYWASVNSVRMTAELAAHIQDGFGPGPAGEDPFDALVGLLGMLNVLLSHRPEGRPSDPAVLAVEGWILGQSWPREERP